MKTKTICRGYALPFIVLGILVSTMFISCNFLNVNSEFDDTMKFDSIFSNYQYLSEYMWGITDNFPDEGRQYRDAPIPGPLATDEMFTNFAVREFPGLQLVTGVINADNISGTALNIWPTMYKIIRKCNYILSRKDEAHLTVQQDELITGYTHMIRGYAYYYLIEQYGPCVLLGDDVLPTNELSQVYDRPRSTYDECVDYCCNELEEAAKYLPEKVASNLWGRPTRGAAFALIARLRLQQASPLFNGGEAAHESFGSWKRSTDGVNYISQIYDEKKWAVAAAACKRVIDMGIYKLHTVPIDPMQPPRPLPSNVPTADFPNGAGGIDCYRSYSEMFNGETIGSKNPEIIWGTASGELTSYCTQAVFPTIDVMGGWNGLCVTQKLVDAYYMEDGRDKDEASKEYPYNVGHGSITDNDFTKSVQKFSGYTLPAGVYGMYNNRENRFYATIGFSGRYWAVSSNTESKYGPYTVWYDHDHTADFTNLYAGYESSVHNPLDYPVTGYVLTKWVHPSDALKGNGATVLQKYFPIIRYAETLLGYAEALNHLKATYNIELPSKNGGGSTAESYTVSRNTSEISKYFDQIRYRVGLPGLSTSDMADENTLDEIIKREYMIEFAAEGRRYYDVRRWGDYESSEKTGIYGMHMTDTGEYHYYQTPGPVTSQNARNRIIDKKLLFLPLPKAEVRRVSKLDQNPGWEK